MSFLFGSIVVEYRMGNGKLVYKFSSSQGGDETEIKTLAGNMNKYAGANIRTITITERGGKSKYVYKYRSEDGRKFREVR